MTNATTAREPLGRPWAELLPRHGLSDQEFDELTVGEYVFTMPEAAKFLGVPIKQFEYLMQEKYIPRASTFRRKTLEDWLEGREFCAFLLKQNGLESYWWHQEPGPRGSLMAGLSPVKPAVDTLKTYSFEQAADILRLSTKRFAAAILGGQFPKYTEQPPKELPASYPGEVLAYYLKTHSFNGPETRRNRHAGRH